MIALEETAFVIAIVDEGPALSIDALGLVRESPRELILRWLYSLFTPFLLIQGGIE